MPWHSTGDREELVIVLGGSVRLEARLRPRHVSAETVQAGQCAFMPPQTLHQVVNRSKVAATYLYVTAPSR